MNPIVKSYFRAVMVAVLPLLAANDDNWHHYLYAVLLAVLAPLARAADPTDHAFGFTDEDLTDMK
jgi:hypothetical protein